MITNNGYTDGIKIYPSLPLSLNGFGLNINNAGYDPVFSVLISNSSALLGYSYLSSTLQPVTLIE